MPKSANTHPEGVHQMENTAVPPASTELAKEHQLTEAQEPVGARPAYEEIAFIDLETTGLNPDEDRVIEVALCILKLGSAENVRGYSELANPGRPIPARITELTGITDDMVTESNASSVVVAELLDQIGARTIAAYNAKFDIAFLRSEAGRLGRPFNNDSICVMEYARSKHPNLRRYRLGDVCDAFGVTGSGAGGIASEHRAGHDAERAVKLFLAIHAGDAPTQPSEPAEGRKYRRMDFVALGEFHEIRNSAKRIAAEAKQYESKDIQQAIVIYRQAIELLKKAGRIEIYPDAEGDESDGKTNDLGDIDCLNRLTMCLCKLNRGSEAAAAAADYFSVFAREAGLKTSDQIRRRIGKAAANP